MSAKSDAQQGLALLKEAIMDFILQNPEGVTNADITKELGLESDFEGNQKNCLSWSIIGLLVNEGKVKYKTEGTKKLYYAENNR